MEYFKTLRSEIVHTLKEDLPYDGDISDLGNEIGYIIADYFDDEGNDLDTFIMGLKHGVSIKEGTHD